MAVPPTVKHRLTMWPSNSAHRYILKELKASVQTDASAPIFTAAIFTTAKSWKQPKCPSTDKWIDKI